MFFIEQFKSLNSWPLPESLRLILTSHNLLKTWPSAGRAGRHLIQPSTRVPVVNFFTNGLISELSQEDQHRVQKICQRVELTAGQILCNPALDTSKVYFLTGACVALLIEHPSHASLAVGLVGAEGAVGLASVLGLDKEHRSHMVQTAGEAWCADSAELSQLLHKRPQILWVISRHLWQVVQDTARLVAAIQFDDIQARLAAWLLLSCQRSQSQRLQLTHDHLARMLGVRRVSITLAAGALREQGLLSYQRGAIEILDLQGLQKIAASMDLATV